MEKEQQARTENGARASAVTCPDTAEKSSAPNKKTLIFDLDGTMYRGPQIIEGGLAAVRFCQEHDIPYLFMTNNSMRTRQENADHMTKMGYPNMKPELFFNSAMASAMYVRKQYPDRKKAYYIGCAGMKEALEENGFEITEDHPDFVFVGLNREASYADYSKALGHLLDGAILIGTNKDRRLPGPEGMDPGNGAVVALLEYASDQKSPDIAKPGRPILDLCLEHFGLKKENVILIGDNLETDIALGYNNKVKTVFVQTGVHTDRDIERLKIYPDLNVRDLQDLDLFTLTTK